MWEITVKLRPIPSSVENPEGTREEIACDLAQSSNSRQRVPSTRAMACRER